MHKALPPHRSCHHVAAQVEFESNFESGPSYISFKRLVSGAFDAGLIGSACTALPPPDNLDVRARVLDVAPLLETVSKG
jgi:hypothetical protein